MSLDRIKGDIVWTCDECDDTLETSTDDFAEARNDLRAAGWATTKEGEDWVHKCPDCKPSGAGQWWERD